MSVLLEKRHTNGAVEVDFLLPGKIRIKFIDKDDCLTLMLFSNSERANKFISLFNHKFNLDTIPKFSSGNERFELAQKVATKCLDEVYPNRFLQEKNNKYSIYWEQGK